MVEETPSAVPSWSWPERSPAGRESSPSSAPQLSQSPSPDSVPSAEKGTDGDMERARLDQLERYGSSATEPLPGESVRSFAIRTVLVGVVSSGVSLAASFGFELSGAQTAQLIGFVTGASLLGALIFAGRKRGG